MIFNNEEEITSKPIFKYVVRSRETEVYEFGYIVKATSESEAQQKILNRDWEGVETIDDNYLETLNREILGVEPLTDE